MHKTPELFDTRNEKKKMLEFSDSKKTHHLDVGEFWRYREGVNIGNEISKDGGFKRVCLVLQNNLGNGLYLVAPITTKYHAWMEKYYIKVHHREKYGLKECWIILNQVKLIDAKRFSTKTNNHHQHLTLSKLVRIKYSTMIV